MEFRAHEPRDASAIEHLFSSVFAEAEGESEGALIGTLARDLLAQTAPHDLYGFAAVEQRDLVGAILFSRLRFENDPESRTVFLMAPVAVHSDHQGRGVGQSLIRHGLDVLRTNGVEVVVTYGDPAFYAKMGFQPLSPETIPAPVALSQPEGWLGQSLTDDPLAPIAGPCSCVAAFDDPAYW